MAQQLESITSRFVTHVLADNLFHSITHRGHNEPDAIRVGSTVVSWYVMGGYVEVKLERNGAVMTFAGNDRNLDEMRLSNTTADIATMEAIVEDVVTGWTKPATRAA